MPKFTRRHYRKIAEALASDKPLGNYERMTEHEMGTYDEWNTTCLAFVKMLAADNPRFDRERFLVWCNTTI